MSMNAVDIVNAATLEKVVLTQRVAGFLNDNHSEDERAAIENVARMLAQDISLQVREALAFELRTCKHLPHDLAAKIASDVESVASPFLSSTEVFSDVQLAGLVPHLADHAHVTLARRSDIGPQTCLAIVTVGTDKTVSFIIRNDQIKIQEDAVATVTQRFGMNRDMMDLLAKRSDLPISALEKIIKKVSSRCRAELMKSYNLDPAIAEELTRNAQIEAIWRQVEKASPAQVHAYVIDLRKASRVTTDMVMEIADRGCLLFLESVLALDAGLTLGTVRNALYSVDVTAYVSLMQRANISKAAAHEYYRIIANHGDPHSEQG